MKKILILLSALLLVGCSAKDNNSEITSKPTQAPEQQEPSTQPEESGTHVTESVVYEDMDGVRTYTVYDTFNVSAVVDEGEPNHMRLAEDLYLMIDENEHRVTLMQMYEPKDSTNGINVATYVFYKEKPADLGEPTMEENGVYLYYTVNEATFDATDDTPQAFSEEQLERFAYYVEEENQMPYLSLFTME